MGDGPPAQVRASRVSARVPFLAGSDAIPRLRDARPRFLVPPFVATGPSGFQASPCHLLFSFVTPRHAPSIGILHTHRTDNCIGIPTATKPLAPSPTSFCPRRGASFPRPPLKPPRRHGMATTPTAAAGAACWAALPAAAAARPSWRVRRGVAWRAERPARRRCRPDGGAERPARASAWPSRWRRRSHPSTRIPFSGLTSRSARDPSTSPTSD